MNKSDYPEWEMQPRLLTKEETENPALVLDELFDFAHLPQLRYLLWEWLKITVSGSYHHLEEPNEKESVLFLYEKMQKLIEASHLIWKAQQSLQKQEQKKDEHPF